MYCDFGEEAVECLIEAVAGNQEALVSESADVLYHLLVLWVSADVHPSEVWAELERREGISGIAEKAARRVGGVATRKYRNGTVLIRRERSGLMLRKFSASKFLPSQPVALGPETLAYTTPARSRS